MAKDKWSPRYLKEYMTHFLAVIVILPYIYLLIMSGFDPKVSVPSALSTIALLILGYYFGTFSASQNKMKG
jgi:hypothetical protein